MAPNETRTARSDELDRALLDVVRNGVPLTDKAGNAVLDAEAKPIISPPAAAYLQAAFVRFHTPPPSGA